MESAQNDTATKARLVVLAGVFALSIVVTTSGCATIIGRTFEEAWSTSAPGIGREQEALLRNVALTRQTQDGFLPEGQARGVFLGSTLDGCQRVALVSSRSARASRGTRSTNYEVCPDRITAFRANEVAPSYPDSKDARLTLDRVRRSALLYGSQRAFYQRYAIHAQRLGIANARPCRPVETIIVFDDMLVSHALAEVCQ
jgi:hypothetical protein